MGEPAAVSEYCHDHVILLLSTQDFENPPAWLTDNFNIIEGGTHAGKLISLERHHLCLVLGPSDPALFCSSLSLSLPPSLEGVCDRGLLERGNHMTHMPTLFGLDRRLFAQQAHRLRRRHVH